MQLPILRYPDKRLRTIAKPVQAVDNGIRTLVDHLFETMYAESGIGLAATQVNQHKQIIVMDVPESKEDYQILLENRQNKTRSSRVNNGHPLCFINPSIAKKSGRDKQTEGCLSVPGFSAEVERYNQITVEALNEQGEPFTLEANNLLAVCIQHEIDHLNGILFVDRLSKLKQKRFLEKLKKRHKK